LNSSRESSACTVTPGTCNLIHIILGCIISGSSGLDHCAGQQCTRYCCPCCCTSSMLYLLAPLFARGRPQIGSEASKSPVSWLLYPHAGLMFIIWSTYWLYSIIDIHLRTRALGLRAGLPTHTVSTLHCCCICSPSHVQAQRLPQEQHPHKQHQSAARGAAPSGHSSSSSSSNCAHTTLNSSRFTHVA
jgi:hypothetical protein